MVLKSKLEEVAYFAMRKAQVEAMKTERLGVIHVSDLIKPCMRLVWYGKTQPQKTMTTEDMKSLFIGQAVHAVTNVGNAGHEMFLAWNYVTDKVYTLEEARKIPEDDPVHLDIIYGSIDDLIKVDDTYMICDKKTTGSIDYFSKMGKASESHKLQINAYRFLLKKCYGVDAPWGCNIYISNSISKETRDTVVPIVYKLDELDKTQEWVVKNASIIKESLSSRTMPGRTKNYMCDGFCPYATQCFSHE